MYGRVRLNTLSAVETVKVECIYKSCFICLGLICKGGCNNTMGKFDSFFVEWRRRVWL